MKLMVPDISVPASGEKTLRQYRFANVSSVIDNFNADLTIAVTNKRIIQHAETGNSAKAQMIHNELFIENIGGFSFFKGHKFEKEGLSRKLILLFILFAAIGGVAFWQAQPIYDFVYRSIPTIQNNLMFKIGISAIPILIYIILAVIIKAKTKKYVLNMVIYTKDLKPINLTSSSSEELLSNNFIVIPYLKETKAMITEIPAIVLDVQNYGPVEVLKHIDAEESVL